MVEETDVESLGEKLLLKEFKQLGENSARDIILQALVMREIERDAGFGLLLKRVTDESLGKRIPLPERPEAFLVMREHLNSILSPATVDAKANTRPSFWKRFWKWRR